MTVVDLECSVIDALALVNAFGDLLAAAGTSEIGLDDLATLSVIGSELRHQATLIGDAVEQLVSIAPRDPTQSDRAIAEKARVDHKTVAQARSKAAATGEIPQLSATTGKDGKTRPRKPTTQAAPAAPNAPVPLTRRVDELRALAAMAKVSHTTVAKHRAEVEAGGQIGHHAERVGKDGVVQPRKRKPATEAAR